MTKAPIPKAEAIKTIRGRSREFSDIELRKKSLSISNRLIDSDDFIYADNIFLYFSSLQEIVNTRQLIDFAVGCGKSVFLPKSDSTGKFRRFQFTSYDELVKNDSGFWEPKIGIEEDLSDIDLIIVPCIAVSLFGQFVGYGRINYNMILSKSYAVKYSLAFEFQIFHRIEYQRKDMLVDRIITERRIINTREN